MKWLNSNNVLITAFSMAILILTIISIIAFSKHFEIIKEISVLLAAVIAFSGVLISQMWQTSNIKKNLDSNSRNVEKQIEAQTKNLQLQLDSQKEDLDKQLKNSLELQERQLESNVGLKNQEINREYRREAYLAANKVKDDVGRLISSRYDLSKIKLKMIMSEYFPQSINLTSYDEELRRNTKSVFVEYESLYFDLIQEIKEGFGIVNYHVFMNEIGDEIAFIKVTENFNKLRDVHTEMEQYCLDYQDILNNYLINNPEVNKIELKKFYNDKLSHFTSLVEGNYRKSDHLYSENETGFQYKMVKFMKTLKP